MRELLCVLVSLSTSACLFSAADGDGADEPIGGARTVRGTVVDLETGQPIDGTAAVSVSGLVPAPEAAVSDASFAIEGVPDNSALQLLASAPTYQPTFSEAILVGDEDVTGVRAAVVSDGLVTSLASTFGAVASNLRGVLLARAVDESGMPRAGVPRASFVLAGAGASGPHFLGAGLQPLPDATETTSAGWVLYFNVAPGVAELGTAASSAVTLEMAVSPIREATVTLAQIRVTDSAPILPANVSFREHIVPIFRQLGEGCRGCEACHSGNGTGRDRGGLTLDGSANLMYRELREEDPLRVNLAMPERSELLTMPSRESPPDRHPNVTFTSARDPDYLKILVWIREGAKDN